VKRRYKAGDWIRVPLSGDRDAVAVLARACRSRLFGYFFAVPAGRALSHDELRAFRAGDALAAMLFGGTPIEQARWPVIATSLAFDQQAWPFPLFAARGAFGESWQQIRYDPQTVQIVERMPVDASQAACLPDARFGSAHEVETLLRLRLSGAPAARAYGVRELRSPIAQAELDGIDAGRVQFSTALNDADLRLLAAFIGTHPYVDLRVHGFRRGFDARALAPLRALQSLALDVRVLQHPAALRSLRALQKLRLGNMQIDLSFLEAMQVLEQLELRGTRADPAPVLRLRTLRALELENTAPLDLAQLAGTDVLERIVLAYGRYDLHGLSALARLRTLVLRSLDLENISSLSALNGLQNLTLHGLRRVTDLAPLARLPRLRELQITGMPQLNVHHFAPLQACADLQLIVDLGSRPKEREIYRLLKTGA
jgi:hypothetical protein